jgi:hypothetical protein
MENYFKCLDANGYANVVPDFRWPLPQHGRPGKWVTANPNRSIQMCSNGIHFCRGRDILHWLDYYNNWDVDGGGQIKGRIYLFEPKGEMIKGDNKLVARSGRLLKRLKITKKSQLAWYEDVFEQVNKCWNVRNSKKRYQDINDLSIGFWNVFTFAHWRNCSTKFMSERLIHYLEKDNGISLS